MSEIHSIDPNTLKSWLEADQAVLIDVREVVEYQSKSISHARHLPLSAVTIDDAHLPEHRHKKLVIHCQSGRRSQMACEKLVNDGAPFDVWTLEGGIEAWEKAGFPIQTGDKQVLPLDRQVQLTISLMILIGLAIGVFVHGIGLVLPLIAGLGLLNAGLTGWCGLAKLMAKMPWNQVKAKPSGN